MSIGKNSILRVQNAEKNGAMPIVSEAPDMENSTPVASPKKKPAKKTAPAKTPKAAPKAEAPKKAESHSYTAIGEAMPVYLL